VYYSTLPIIVSGSEDGTVKIGHANTYRLENTPNYALERAWLVLHRKRNEVAVGFDDGLVVLKPGRDEPSYSKDPSSKLIYTRGSEVLTSTLQTAAEDVTPEGARIPLPPRELGSTKIYANAIVHSPNGRFVTVVGDGEYIIYTALAWRNKAFGPGNRFAWADNLNMYRKARLKIKVYRTFRMARLRVLVHLALKELMVVRCSVPAEEALLSSGIGRRARLYGGLTSRLPMSVLSH